MGSPETDQSGTDSTVDALRDTGSRTGRRLALAFILVLVIAGGVGVFGVRAGTVTSSASGYKMTVTYPHIARAGLDVPWRVTVLHPGGFSGDVTLAVSAHYFDIFETQGFHPTPSDETSTPEFLYLTFTAPPGDVLEVTYDAYIQPASQLGRRADTVLIVDKREVTRVGYRTWLVP